MVKNELSEEEKRKKAMVEKEWIAKELQRLENFKTVERSHESILILNESGFDDAEEHELK